jgi:hypothetical protein
MQASGGIVADVHAEPLTDMLTIGEMLEVRRRVVLLRLV